jgi:2-isopropylmalate synthase
MDGIVTARRIFVFDTTLRDGEQAPGCSMTAGDKLVMARRLETLGVDVIEAGFPAASAEEFAAVDWIAREIRGVEIAAITRAKASDIDRTWEALQGAANPRIHVILPASDILLGLQLHKSREEALEIAGRAVAHAAAFTANVEFSAMDATRADRYFLCTLLERAIDAGAGIVNIADTVGYAMPGEFGDLVRYVLANVRNIGNRPLSVHCHDDLGLATANTLAAVEQGAGQVKCTINGIGERAGNAALEEVVMALRTRQDRFAAWTGVRTEHLYGTSRLLTEITGIAVQPNKAVVGANAFAHESGIHQDGMLKDSRTYEIMTPESVGVPSGRIVLGKHSGRSAVRYFMEERGSIGEEEIDDMMKRIKETDSRDEFRTLAIRTPRRRNNGADV